MGRRPGLVLQNNVLNDSNLNTVIVLAVTSTMKYGELPGNVVLRKGYGVILRLDFCIRPQLVNEEPDFWRLV